MEPKHDMSKTKTYEKRSDLNCSVEALRAFHQQQSALATLTPPPIFVQVQRDDRTSLTEGEIEFTLWMGPVPIRWLARHSPGPDEHSFTDQMIKGPMAYWKHDHIFQATDKGAALIDRLSYSHKSGWRGWLTRLVFDGIPLRILFFYRHLRTRMAVS